MLIGLLTRQLSVVAIVIACTCGIASGTASAKECRQKRLDRLFNNQQIERIVLNCTTSLPAKQTIKKRFVFFGHNANNNTLDCNGGTIDTRSLKNSTAIMIRSKNVNGNWQRPENITIKNCKIYGSIRIAGMGRNGEAEKVRVSSRQLGHTERLQAAAPTNIRLDRVHLISDGPIPLYLAPGVTKVRLTNSRITGKSDSVAIYLDAESGYNVIKNSTIAVDTKKREQIAIDGSAYNVISGNYLSGLNHGGIYLYRNCGEGGTIRHQPPQYNTIVGNTFYYNKYKGFTPAVHIAARNGNRNYCNDDRGLPFGSSADDRDYARYNAVIANRFIKRRPNELIKVDDRPNKISGNYTTSN